MALLFLYQSLVDLAADAAITSQSAASHPLAAHSSHDYIYKSSSASRLPAGLQNTTVPYEESRGTWVQYPQDAKDLLDREIAKVPSPLVLDVVSSVSHFRAPVWDLLKGLVHRFRNQNQIIYVRAHCYVGDGLTETGCRIEFLNTDTGVSTEHAVASDPCERRCTNDGRYCAPEIPHDLGAHILPKVLVEEALRRLCINDLYHATDLKHWEYLEAFEQLECHDSQDFTDCTKTALSHVASTDYASVEDCMERAGGLDGDQMNVRLQEQLDRQRGSYHFTDVPLLHIAGQVYKGDWDVSSLLDSVCQAFQDVNNVTPLACGFCQGCKDVRRCLWYLECDGTSFDTQTYLDNLNSSNNSNHDSNQQQLNAPTTETAAPTPSAQQDIPSDTTTLPLTSLSSTEAPQSAPAAYSEEKYEEDENVNTAGFFMGGILAGLVVGLAPALWFVQHEKRTRRQITAALAAREETAAAAAAEVEDYHDSDDLALSAGSHRHRPTREEMSNLEDITLEEQNHGGIGEVGDGTAKRAAAATLRRPPKMTFGLHKIV